MVDAASERGSDPHNEARRSIASPADRAFVRPPATRAGSLAPLLTAGLAVLAAPSLAAAGSYVRWPDFKLYGSVAVEAGATSRELPGCTRCDGASPTLGLGGQLGIVARGLDDTDARTDTVAVVVELWGQTLQFRSADDERHAVQLDELGAMQLWLGPQHSLWLKYGARAAQIVNAGVPGTAPGTRVGLALMVGGGATIARTEPAALDLQARLGFDWFGDGHTTAATVGLGVHWP